MPPAVMLLPIIIGIAIGSNSKERGHGCAASIFERANPVTGEIATRADDAVDAGKAALPGWSSLGPNARRTHGLIVQAFVEAGLDGGIVNLITNAPQDAADVVGAMIHHPAVRRVNFTGSTAVGKIIAKRCAENLKPVILELGGKAPLIVLEDADLDEAVKAAAFGAFMNQGQIGPTVHNEAQMPLRRRQGIRLWQVRRQGGDRQLHRTALDHHGNRAGPLSHLILNSRIFSSCA